VSLPQIPVQGDAKRLAQISSGLKRTGGTYGPVVQRRPTGRPQGTTGTPAPRETQQVQPAPQPAQPQLPPEHVAYMDELARSAAALQQAQRLATLPGAGSWTRLYLQMAQQAHLKAAVALQQNTPNFE